EFSRSDLEMNSLLADYRRRLEDEARLMDRNMSRRVEQIGQSCRDSIMQSNSRSSSPTNVSSSASGRPHSTMPNIKNPFARAPPTRNFNNNTVSFHLQNARSPEPTTSNEKRNPTLSVEVSSALWDSPVYRRSSSHQFKQSSSASMLSLNMQSIRRGSRSILSEFSMSQLSSISFFALPIYADELYNGSVYTDCMLHTNNSNNKNNGGHNDGISLYNDLSFFLLFQSTSLRSIFTLSDSPTNTATHIRRKIISFPVGRLAHQLAVDVTCTLVSN